MPKPIRIARAVLVIKIVQSALAAMLIVGALPTVAGYETPTAADPRAVMSVLGFILVYLCVIAFLTIRMSSRRRWVRIAVLVVEGLALAGYVAGLLTGSTTRIDLTTGIGMTVLVLVCMSGEAKEYFTE